MALDPIKKSAPKEDKNLKQAPMPPLPFARHIVNKVDEVSSKDIERIAHKEGDLTVQEASILLKDLEVKGKKIKDKLDELYRLRGASPDYIAAYINNPSNFTAKQWELVNKKRRELVDSLNLPSELVEQGEKFAPTEPGHVPAPSTPSSTVEAKPKERRKLGGARRGWLPMR